MLLIVGTNMQFYTIFNDSFVDNISYLFNTSHNVTSEPPLCDEAGGNGSSLCVLSQPIHLSTFDYFLALFLAIFILCIVIGNVFVILSVLLFREMRTQTNGMIVSLASADLLVALIVLPISLHFEIMGNVWTLGPDVCEFWITSDVFCCTASILNIVIIAVDRYWLITKNVRYTHGSTFSRQRVCIVMALLAWVASAIISCLPLMGWNSGYERDDPSQCLISQDYGYTIFSTFGAFWFPLGVILAVYFKIFRIARKRARNRLKQRSIHPSINTSTVFTEAPPANGHSTKQRYQRPSESGSPQHSPGAQASIRSAATPAVEPATPNTNGSVRFHEETVDNANRADDDDQRGSIQSGSIHSNTTNQGSVRHNGAGVSSVRHIGRGFARTYLRNGRGRRLARSRDSRVRIRNRTRNSARTLGFIIGGFMICWLPFFIFATLLPFCAVCAVEVPPPVMSVTLWLGYSNSLINPLIYAIWDKNFRRSFKRLAKCDIKWHRILH